MLKYNIFFGLLLFVTFSYSQISFEESTSIEIDGFWYFGTIDFADIDGDNDLDLLIGGRDNNNDVLTKLYTNDGSGIFTEKVNQPLAYYFQGNSNFADIDGDGDEDIFLAGSWGGKARMYKNDGEGNFSEIQNTPFFGFSYNANVFMDIDNDNDLDLLISGRQDSDFSPITRLYKNDGKGNYTVVSGTQLENLRRSTGAHADVDGDNDMDLIIAGENIGDTDITKLYLNDGNGNFTPSSNNQFHAILDGSIKFADVDNDNDQDVFIIGSSDSKLYLNDGYGNFSEKLNTSFSGSKMDIADVDGDDDIDIVFLGTEESVLYTNDGQGNFQEIVATPFKATSIGNIKFADVDGDNDPDILITGRENGTDTQITKLYINNGITLTTLHISNLDLNELTLFPNPSASNNLKIKFNFNENTNAQLNVYNTEGYQLLSQKIETSSNEQIISLNTSQFPAGKYIVEIKQGVNSAFGKFIKTN